MPLSGAARLRSSEQFRGLRRRASVRVMRQDRPASARSARRLGAGCRAFRWRSQRSARSGTRQHYCDVEHSCAVWNSSVGLVRSCRRMARRDLFVGRPTPRGGADFGVAAWLAPGRRQRGYGATTGQAWAIFSRERISTPAASSSPISSDGYTTRRYRGNRWWRCRDAGRNGGAARSFCR